MIERQLAVWGLRPGVIYGRVSNLFNQGLKSLPKNFGCEGFPVCKKRLGLLDLAVFGRGLRP